MSFFVGSGVEPASWVDARPLNAATTRPRPGRAAFGERLDSAQDMHRSDPPGIEVLFQGPYSWDPGDSQTCLYDAPVACQPGVYLWSVPHGGGFLVHYVGMTTSSFASRMQQHRRLMISCEYHVYEPAAFRSGVLQTRWPGCYGKDGRTIRECHEHAHEFLPEQMEVIRAIRFFVAPMERGKRIIERIESAVDASLRSGGGMAGSFLPAGIRMKPRRESEPPMSCRVSASRVIHGLPAQMVA